jgi:hypothetical protein
MDRKTKIIEIISSSDKPVSASKIAKELGVSRQIIVGDVALLRASGEDITATPRGYILDPNRSNLYTIAVKHNNDQLEEELNTIVDLGGKVEDVIVEHPLYGEIKGNLHIYSRYDVSKFMSAVKDRDVTPLSLLTDGVHLHTITAPDEETLERIKEALDEKHILLKQ